MRCFTCIPLTEKARKEVVQLQEKLRKSRTKMKLVEKENLHLTLEFLGDIPSAEVEEQEKKLVKIGEPSFDVELKGIGVFPNPNFIRVVWVGVGKGKQKVEKIYERICTGRQKQKYIPHITLARIKSRPDQVLRDFLSTSFQVPMRVSKVTLMQSKLSPEGPKYSQVAEVELS